MLDYRFVDGTRLTAVIEALIFSSPQPIDWEKLAEIVQESEEELIITEGIIQRVTDRLNERYEENDLAFRIEQTGGGYTFVTQPRYHPWLSIFQHENAYRKLSQSATETLAIVAYRQPITKPEVDDIRGVDSGYILRQLLEKMLVRVSGRADSPGKPLLYKTTKHFLKHFGINSVDELPKPREIDEILKDDDMADHRRLLMERQMELEDEEARQMFDEYSEKKEQKESGSDPQNSVNGSGTNTIDDQDDKKEQESKNSDDENFSKSSREGDQKKDQSADGGDENETDLPGDSTDGK